MVSCPLFTLNYILGLVEHAIIPLIWIVVLNRRPYQSSTLLWLDIEAQFTERSLAALFNVRKIKEECKDTVAGRSRILAAG